MLRALRLCAPLGPAVVMTLIVGCTDFPSPPATTPAASPSPTSLPATPFFRSDVNESKGYRTLVRDQEGQLTSCAHDHACDQAHYSRALLALFDNQRVAAKHFQDVIALAPKSRLAAASTDWLKFLQDWAPDGERSGLWAKATQGLILELLNREQAVKEELSAREKKLDELSSQIESLKLIDQEMNVKTHRLRPRTKIFQETSDPANTSK